MNSRAGFAVALLAALAVALALRLPHLGQRPMHTDEAVHAVKFAELAWGGNYQYDPAEYHGPTLYYFTFPALWLSGTTSFAQTQAALYRIVPVVFGVGLILLLWLIADGIGRPAAIAAAVLTAVSPALVFYSRYYIQEMLLVCFTFLVLGAGWRYVRTRRVGWALLAGAGVGFMHATKETCVLVFGALAAAAVLTLIWGRWIDRKTPASQSPSLSGRGQGEGPTGQRIPPSLSGRGKREGSWAALVALLAAVLVSAALFSVFFTRPRGILHSVAAFDTYVNRAQGASHAHPWTYYLQTLLYTHEAGGPLWSEGLIVGLAVIGGAAALRRTRASSHESSQSFLRFVAFYTLVLTAIYSAIPYKTPWCLLGFLHAMILLAGSGVVVLIRSARPILLRGVVAVALLTGAVHLGYQSWRGNITYAAHPRNPYVYAQTTPDVEDLTRQLERIADVAPDGRRLLIKVIAPNPWPLPWYLRGFDRVGYWETVPDSPAADVVLVSHTLVPDLAPRLPGDYEVGYHGLRRDEVLLAYVRRDLWNAYLARWAGGPPAASRPTTP